jgi:hypothetical protein
MKPQTNRAIIAENKPLRLTTEEMAHPYKVVRSFFKSFHLEDIRQFSWQMMIATLCRSDEDLGTDLSRESLLAFYEEQERALEAIYIIIHPVPINNDI